MVLRPEVLLSCNLRLPRGREENILLIFPLNIKVCRDYSQNLPDKEKPYL